MPSLNDILEKEEKKEENELLNIALIRSHTMSHTFKSSECEWSIFDDEIIVKMNYGRCYHFPMTSVLYYYVESLEEEEDD